MASNTAKSQDVKSLKDQKFQVSLDNSVEEVLEWDKEGAILLFRYERDKFHTGLDPSKLSAENKRRYFVAREMYDENPDGDIANSQELSDLEFDFAQISARDKMAKPKSNDWAYAFRTPDMIQEAQAKGWQVVTGEKNQLNRAGSGVTHLLGKNGKTEQVLMKMKRERAEALKRLQHDDINRFVQGKDDAMREEFNRLSGGSDLKASGVNLTTAEE